ncbi:accessory Sec system translocase SecA2 [Tenuibacillus multivorans]|uniref:Protein translocase subunit SecA n=1 Tax=Tenuibacillus multivorans TaxID=237069 RepID=A0A1H0G640_9BACI|nr:accessory Sec system translocase SecA2 [Tenuibacillus multivorans]GEL78727.1 protein translocase subunit SecA 2 [Tenuibacillus multivorans]SDO02365.1 preprotein translocase subunit SecA [Tenuibacillus multivorans]
MFSNIRRFVNDASYRQLKSYKKIVKQINELEDQYSQYSDEELQNMTNSFKDQLEQGKTIYDIQADAFAVVREVSKRVLGMRHFDVQLIGGLVLLEGHIAEMATGEGKTLVASLPAYLRALEGKGVHIITVNEYLAKRDKDLIGQIHEFLGLTVGLNVPGLAPSAKKKAYQADITYGLGTEFGFDFLRDNMVQDGSQKVQRPYHYAIIDEIDSVLVDEAKTPLIIAGKTKGSDKLQRVCSQLAKTFRQDDDYLFDPETKATSLIDSGITKVEKAFGIENLFDIEHQTLYHYMIQAVRAHVMFEKDVDYIVQDGEIMLVDMFTGRIMEGRTLSDGLHQAIEAKEGLTITDENKTQANITIQNYFRMYPTLSGMTGTAKTEEKEFQHVYGMNVVQVPTNKPIERVDHPDVVYINKEQKYVSLVNEVRERHIKGQPVLIGTTSIIQSEQVADYLDEAGLEYEILNAKSVEQEVRLISLAGQKGQITVATNMAGRGTDIMLGEGVKELGGLCVIGTERHGARRVDNQLKGRAGRQGDPGETRFIISLEDEIINRYAKEEKEKKLEDIQMDRSGRVINKDIHKFVDTTQKISEGSNFNIREFNLKLDDVINDQRKIIYQFRDQLLETDNAMDIVLEHIPKFIYSLVEKYCPETIVPEEWPIKRLEQQLTRFFPGITVQLSDQDYEDIEELQERVSQIVNEYTEFIDQYRSDETIQQKIKQLSIATLDHHWVKHLERMNRLREGVGLRQYQQEDPIRLYQDDGFDLFEHSFNEMNQSMTEQLARLVRAVLQKEKEERQKVKN